MTVGQVKAALLAGGISRAYQGTQHGATSLPVPRLPAPLSCCLAACRPLCAVLEAPSDLSLFFAGQWLEDGRILADCRVPAGCQVLVAMAAAKVQQGKPDPGSAYWC